MDTGLLRIVVVDDSQPVRDRVVRALLACGPVSCVDQAQSVTEAISAIERHEPDALVLDLHLIGGTGFDVLRAVRPTRPGLRVAVLTSFASDQYRAACMRAGADFVFDKLTEFDQLVERMRAWAGADRCGTAADAVR